MARKKIDKKTKERSGKMLELIKKKRNKHGFTQDELSQKSGISIDVIRSIETGKIKTPSIFIFLDLIKILKIEWEEIKKL